MPKFQTGFRPQSAPLREINLSLHSNTSNGFIIITHIAVTIE